MDVDALMRILRSMADRSLTPEEATELLTYMVEILARIVPHVKKRVWKLVLHGIIGTLQELSEHIHAID